jgi:hypothetical protein
MTHSSILRSRETVFITKTNQADSKRLIALFGANRSAEFTQLVCVYPSFNPGRSVESKFQSLFGLGPIPPGPN